jgi:hypothetical protein
LTLINNKYKYFNIFYKTAEFSPSGQPSTDTETLEILAGKNPIKG